MGIQPDVFDVDSSAEAIEGGLSGDEPFEEAQPEGFSGVDPEKRRKAFWLLRLFVHVRKCQRREQVHNILHSNGEQLEQCMVPRCRGLKYLFNHLPTCSLGESCQVRSCFSMRRLFSHYIDCINVDCVICIFLKQAKFQQLVAI